ncbi:MAG: hypothetical protein ABIC95_05665, partial [archaeon]
YQALHQRRTEKTLARTRRKTTANVGQLLRLSTRRGAVERSETRRSSHSPDLTSSAINYYNEKRHSRGEFSGIICITPKMKMSYEKISADAIPTGFIPIFSPIDLIKYAFRDEKDKDVFTKVEIELTYSDLLIALKKIREEQKDVKQRIYLTLGDYGSIGVDYNGDVYRVDVFKNDGGKNKTGAGDVFASVITRYEHEQFYETKKRRDITTILALASAAAILHINNQSPEIGYLANRLYEEKEINYENIGNINTLDLNSSTFNRQLKEVSKEPASGTYHKIRFHLST